ncbi:MAG: electron transport complex subunit RsxC [Candidatus Omnitrophica bacterium]|nr:electron transport complex subunit RsxC [Candidatus Omnitrophota bacterium]
MKIFRQDIRFDDYKDLSLSTITFKRASLPDEIQVYLQQHQGHPAIPVVHQGDHVEAGAVLAVAQGDFSAHVHSSISGKVSLATSEWIRVESDGSEDSGSFLKEVKSWRDVSREEILSGIFDAGIVGMGGEGFPAYFKIKNAEKKGSLLIINGCESEPFLTSDYFLMVSRATEIIYGAELLLKASGREKCIIAVEDNKLEAIELLLSKARALHVKNMEVKTLPARYPQGSEAELIRSLSRSKALGAGVPLIHNVATAFAVYEAVRYKKPLIERMVTVTGHCVVEPKNLWCRIGTPASHLVQNCKGFLRDPIRVIFGGPMSGLAITNLDTPIIKATRGIVALAPEFSGEGEEKPCTRCGLCLNVCPEELSPELLIRVIQKENGALAKEFRLSSCTECGNCTFICPSKIPIQKILKIGKTNLLHESFPQSFQAPVDGISQVVLG